MLVIPSIDVENGRSRIVYWPGAATGVGSPTDRPERIAERFVAMGAQLIHVVDRDGARAGGPVNLEAIGRIAGHVAVPLQVAGGMEGADNIRLAFAAGATRVVVSMAVADQPELLAECLAVAGDWLAVGLDMRPERIAAYPWHRPAPPSLVELAGELADNGVRRLVLSMGGARPDLAFLSETGSSDAAPSCTWQAGPWTWTRSRACETPGSQASSSERRSCPEPSTSPKPWRPLHDPRFSVDQNPPARGPRPRRDAVRGLLADSGGQPVRLARAAPTVPPAAPPFSLAPDRRRTAPRPRPPP